MTQQKSKVKIVRDAVQTILATQSNHANIINALIKEDWKDQKTKNVKATKWKTGKYVIFLSFPDNINTLPDRAEKDPMFQVEGVKYYLNTELGAGSNFDDLNTFLNKFGGGISNSDMIILNQSNSSQMVSQPNNVQNGSSNQNERIPLNQILYGPPGTGKTYNTVNKALDIVDPQWATKTNGNRRGVKELFDKYVEDGHIVFTTFHQAMGYEDFIEGIKPTTNNKGDVIYQVENGIFKKLCQTAKDQEQRYVLIIDEINRGNVANIFGELITLIEDGKRLGQDECLRVTLPYSHDSFCVPSNLYIIGTMNTADRSVEALDSALRRRFVFVEMMPRPDLLPTDLNRFLTIINQRIEVLKDREHQIGHSYLMGVDSRRTLIDVIYRNIIPLLQEYFYGDYEKIQMILGKGFVKKITKPVEFAVKDNSFDVSETRYQIICKEAVNIDKALEGIGFGYGSTSNQTDSQPLIDNESTDNSNI